MLEDRKIALGAPITVDARAVDPRQSVTLQKLKEDSGRSGNIARLWGGTSQWVKDEEKKRQEEEERRKQEEKEKKEREDLIRKLQEEEEEKRRERRMAGENSDSFEWSNSESGDNESFHSSESEEEEDSD